MLFTQIFICLSADFTNSVGQTCQCCFFEELGIRKENRQSSHFHKCSQTLQGLNRVWARGWEGERGDRKGWRTCTFKELFEVSLGSAESQPMAYFPGQGVMT